jgi:hypothetical protein
MRWWWGSTVLLLFKVDSSSNLLRLRELEELVDIDFRDEEELVAVVGSIIEIWDWKFVDILVQFFFTILLLVFFPFDISSFIFKGLIRLEGFGAYI